MRCSFYWKTLRYDQLHGTVDRDAEALTWNLAVVLKQQIFASVKVRSGLIAVVDIEARIREGVRHLRKFLLLDRSVALQIFALPIICERACENVVLLVPLVSLPVHLFKARVDDATHQEAKEEEDNNEAEETPKEDNDATGIDIGHLIAGSFAVVHRVRRFKILFVISGHVLAPASPRGAGRLCSPADVAPVDRSSSKPRAR